MRVHRMNSKALLEPNVFLLANFFTDTYLLTEQTPGIKQNVALDLKMKGKFGFLNLTFIGPCVANIFAEYKQQDATFQIYLFL